MANHLILVDRQYRPTVFLATLYCNGPVLNVGIALCQPIRVTVWCGTSRGSDARRDNCCYTGLHDCKVGIIKMAPQTVDLTCLPRFPEMALSGGGL